MRYLLALVTLISLSGTALSQGPRKGSFKRADNMESHLKTVRSPIVAAITSATWEYYTNVTIPANGSLFLDSTTDFSSSTNLQITVRSANGDIANLAIAPAWSVPGAPSFNVSTVALGSDFFFNNTGGASFAVAGKQLRTFLYNTGSATMTLSSVIVYTPFQ